MKGIELDPSPLDPELLEAVGGGWGTVVKTAIGWATSKLLNSGADAVSGYLSSHAGGGADDGTWTSVGNSQMGA